MQKLQNLFRQLCNGLRYLTRGDLSGLVRRLRWYRTEHTYVKLQRRLASGNARTWGILCTPHTLYIADAISERLFKNGIANEVITGTLADYDHEFYIVLCPQMFSQLPHGDKRVVFQLEQSVSSRWFTPDYMKILKDSVGVLDYSLSNIHFLSQKGVKYPQVHYLPIGTVQSRYERESKKFDFVFYGDNLSSERRRKFLSELQRKYKVKICNGVFGDDMHKIIRQAKVVINIHYHDGALLETPRICECLSLGVPVLSEGSGDQNEYPEFNGAVQYFDEGSIESMMRVAAQMLENLSTLNDAVQRSVSISTKRFEFMLDRFLVVLGVIPANVILESPIYVSQNSSFFALSLPETIERRKAIEQSRPTGCQLFDGIRHRIGWIGCGSSFNALSRYAISNDIERLMVLEDDAILPEEFDTVIRTVNQYLDKRTDHWDIFSGLMADVNPEAKVLSVENNDGRTYVTIDKMTSMVFNVYNQSALELLSKWNPLDTDAVANTVDRYLEQQNGLRVIVCLPFLVGYNEDVNSTLWGFENSRYMPMIENAQKKIEALARDWQARNG